MKRLLAFLGSVSLMGSAVATVVACTGPTTPGIDWGKYNNSLPNMEGAAAALAKQLILGDQYGLSLPTMNDTLGKLQAKDVVETTTGAKYDDQDFNLKEDSTLFDLNDQYFGNVKYNEIKLTEDINLSGNVGSENDQLWKFLKDKLGLDLGDTTNLINAVVSTILPSLTGSGLQELLQTLLPGQGLDKILPDLMKDIDDLTLKGILFFLDNLDKQFTDKIGQLIENFDVGVVYSDMKVEALTSAALLSLTNAIGLIVKPDYETKDLTADEVTDSKEVETKAEAGGEELGKALGDLLFSKEQEPTTFATELENTIDRYVQVAAYLFQFLEFLQIQFSLFDDFKDVQPTDANHLFDTEKTNKKVIQEVLGSGKTLRDLAGGETGTSFAGSFNLKYFLAIFRDAFSSLDEPTDEKGYSLQKFLTILFIDTKEVNIDNWVDTVTGVSMASSFARVTSGLLSQLLTKFLGSLADLGMGGIILPGLIKPGLKRFLTTFLEQLLSGQNLAKPVINLVDDVINLLRAVNRWIPDDVEIGDLNLKEIIQWIITNKSFILTLLPGILDTLPLFEKENGWQELYSGNPLKTDKLLEILETLQKLVGESPILTSIVELVQNLGDTLTNLLPDHQNVNLKNLLTTPIGKIGQDSVVPPEFGSYYFEKSIYEIITDVCDTTGVKVTGKEKLTNFPEAFNFKLSHLKRLWELIIKYDYEIPGFEDYSKDGGTNLISIILEHPEKVSAILGWISDDEQSAQQRAFGKGSLLDFIFTEILQTPWKKDPNADPTDDPFYFFANLFSSIFIHLNKPGLDLTETFQTLFLSEDNFEFQYQTPNYDQNQGLLSQIIIVTYHNPETMRDWSYTMVYSRDKVSELFKVNQLMKKEIIEEITS